MDTPYLPPKTASSLSSPPVNGTRHETARKEAIAMIGNGWSSAVVFNQLRSKYPEDVSDRELRDIVSWAEKKPLVPSIPLNQENGRKGFFLKSAPEKPKQKPFKEHAAWWLSGQVMEREEFATRSQIQIPEKMADALVAAFEMLWLGTESLNIVCTHLVEDGKARPHGKGRIVSRDKWVEYVRTKGVPGSQAGAWLRPNPCKPQGTGAAGSVTDSDIVAWKYLLLESDVLPLNMQLALFSRLKIPIAAVVMSGGISAHAWVKMESKSVAAFTETARRILVVLAPFGIDQANKNPSRLSRLPGAVRVIGAANGGAQTLLWLNPGKAAITEGQLEAFESSLLLPAIEEKPFKRVVKESLERYQDLMENKGKLGTPTGFADFDRDTGGLMPMQMSVIAGESNAGKSTVSINIINAALMSSHGVVLFTLEMGRDEIADMLFSINCNVDRNHFNTGNFSESEIANMTGSMGLLSKLPFWIYDESTLTANQIRQRILELKSDEKIKLAVVDYCQIVAPDGGDNREQEVAQIARVLCATAKDAKIALVVLSQLNDDRRLRESRVIGHEAHNVFLLENQEKESKMVFKVIKGRRIRKRDYPLYYDPIHCRLASVSKLEEEEPRRSYKE